jgi:antagonist of KipI
MILVEAPGLFTTVQDLGRHGYGPLGVSASGAADPVALQLANLLVGNPKSAAALEMTLVGGTFVFPDGGAIAITGSDFAPTVDGVPLPIWTECCIRPGQRLKIASTRSGARCYLAVHGGIQVPPILGSASTHILTHLGGMDGRQLRKGDVLKINAVPDTAHKRPRAIASEIAHIWRRPVRFRTTIAPQTDAFSFAARATFYKSQYKVSQHSNRMGLRLEGPVVEAPYSGQMITEGASLGSVQIPAGGQPIILFVEQQTTGGYPKIANIISADLASVGQLCPNDVIQFELVSTAHAQALIREQEQLIQELSHRLRKGEAGLQ